MNSPKFTRRDFLKLVSAYSMGALTSLVSRGVRAGREHPNIILILFDAMSATNLSVYGYERETTPELMKFADRCTVYNAHYSASNFTSSGTASMLTGMLPWKNRAITQGSLITKKMLPYNMYSLLGENFYKLAFSQNFWPDRLVGQFYGDVNDFLPQTKYSMRGNTLVQSWVGKDRALASIAFDDFLFPADVDTYGSSWLGYFYKSRVSAAYEYQRHQQGYRSGIPEVEGYFAYQNEIVMQGVLSEILNLHEHNQPYFSYFHLFSPHAPYRPSDEFRKYFDGDNLQIPDKKANPVFTHMFTQDPDVLLNKRRLYDQQIAQLDVELGEMIKNLDRAGILDNSYVIITSDHGEMFERGFMGHGGIMMYEPIIRIPLLIHSPGQKSRKDVHVPTSNIDLLPTLLSIAGLAIPEQVEGIALPGFGGVENEDRPIFSMFAWENSVFLPLRKAAFSMRKGEYKLIAYLGYTGNDKNLYELYNLANDPEELNNLSSKESGTLSSLQDEFWAHLNFANSNYIPGS